MTSSKFEELLRLYKEKYGLDGEKILKMHVDNIRRELLVNEHTALEILYERTKKFSIKPERVIEISPQLKLNVRHDGESFTILYFPITEFVEELNLLGRALEYLEKKRWRGYLRNRQHRSYKNWLSWSEGLCYNM